MLVYINTYPFTKGNEIKSSRNAYTYMYVYLCSPPPPATRKMAHFARLSITVIRQRLQKSKNPKSENPKALKSKNLKIQKFKNPKIRKSENLKLFTSTESCKCFWIFGVLDFWNFDFWNLDFWMLVFWILRLVDICTPGTAFPCTVGARVR